MSNKMVENDVHAKGICDLNLEPTDCDIAEDCSICMDPLDATRTTVKLLCGHVFHLDCIGSVFNVKKKMECALCRNVEPGRWLYASGGGYHQDPDIVNLAEVLQANHGFGPQLPFAIRGEPVVGYPFNFWAPQSMSDHFFYNHQPPVTEVGSDPYRNNYYELPPLVSSSYNFSNYYEPAVRGSFNYPGTEAGPDPYLNNHHESPMRSSSGFRATEAGSGSDHFLNDPHESPVRNSIGFWATEAESDPHLRAWYESRIMQMQIERTNADMDNWRSLSNLMFGGEGGNGEDSSGVDESG